MRRERFGYAVGCGLDLYERVPLRWGWCLWRRLIRSGLTARIEHLGPNTVPRWRLLEIGKVAGWSGIIRGPRTLIADEPSLRRRAEEVVVSAKRT